MYRESIFNTKRQPKNAAVSICKPLVGFVLRAVMLCLIVAGFGSGQRYRASEIFMPPAGDSSSQDIPSQDVPSDSSRSIPLLTPLSSLLSQRASERAQESSRSHYDSYLPGFGTGRTRSSRVLEPVEAFTEMYEGGSLELAPSYQRLVPAIYIDGAGFVPITHPAIEPYLDPKADRPETNQNIVMVPEYRLAAYYVDNGSSPPESSRMINVDGATLLSLPARENVEPIAVSAQSGWTKQTEDFDIFFLEGDCCIRQGSNSVQGPHAVVWVERKKKGTKQAVREVTVYLESDSKDKPLYLELDPDSVDAKIYDTKWFGRFVTQTTVLPLIMKPDPPMAREPAIYHRALEMMSPDYSVIRQAQYVAESPTPRTEPVSTPPRYRRISLNSRGDNLMDIRFDPYPNNPERGILVITKGLNLIIEGVTDQDLLLGDVVDISADHAVVWSNNPTKIRRNSDTKEESNLDFEVYLEGNIIFRDGARTIEAQRMYYDAKNKIAYILDGRLSTPIIGIKNIEGSIKIRAEVLQQLGDGLFTAKNSLVTTSQLGEPTYSLRSRTMTLNERTGAPSWGSTEPRTQQILVSENNYIAMRNVPVLYWPWMAADLKDPTFYIKNIAYGNSSVYGNQVKTLWNPFQILNIRNRPDWLDGEVFVGWSEERGISYRGNFDYSPSSFFGIPGPVDGDIYYWGLNDQGAGDNLGGSRRKSVTFPEKYRYRFYWNHRQEIEPFWIFSKPLELTGQVGKVSDRNLLNAFFNDEWNENDNATTSVGLKYHCDNSSVSIFTEYAMDEFYSNPNWLPRLDHYLLGQSLLNDRLTWYEHTRVGFMDYHTTTVPYDWRQDGRLMRYLPWELTTDSKTNLNPNPETTTDPDRYPKRFNASFEVFSTRHELDLPFNIGPVRCVPYALGDFSHWGQDRSGKDVQRFYGQGGVRLNLPFWKVMPNCSNRTWYVNGLAHKIDFDAEFSYARADQSMENLAMTDAMDNWSIEDFRRRYAALTTGIYDPNYPVLAFPRQYDPRYYALRNGFGGNVTASNMEIADDMTLMRFGMTHRWQTKRGPVGRRRIIDWITFSTHFNYYPESKQNYGKSVGMIDYDFLWHVGDRFSLFSMGMYDNDQHITRIGGAWRRPERGSFALSLDSLQGVIDRDYLTMAVSYDMNEKYALTYSTSYDITRNWRNTGHNFLFTRTGESFRILVGALYNESRDDWSFSFGIEPVFMKGIAKKMRRTSMEGDLM